MSSKPPLCCWLIILRAAELRVGFPIQAKIIFGINRARRWIELTASMRTIDVQAPYPLFLPETCCLVHSLVISDADKLYLLTLASSNVIDNVEIFEVSSNVISKIHTLGWVTACCSPVSGVTLQGFHSCQTQAVQLPVLGVLIHWRVHAEWSIPEWGKGTIWLAPRHHQGPSSAALWLKIAISWKTVTVGVKQFVYITLGNASFKVIQTGIGMESLSWAHVCRVWLRSRAGVYLNKN